MWPMNSPRCWKRHGIYPWRVVSLYPVDNNNNNKKTRHRPLRAFYFLNIPYVTRSQARQTVSREPAAPHAIFRWWRSPRRVVYYFCDAAMAGRDNAHLGKKGLRDSDCCGHALSVTPRNPVSRLRSVFERTVAIDCPVARGWCCGSMHCLLFFYCFFFFRDEINTRTRGGRDEVTRVTEGGRVVAQFHSSVRYL